jgi:hypothetical protein
MGKYEPLGQFLRTQRAERVAMSFADIERILKGKLPPSKQHRAWWSNNPSNNVMTKQWLDAGYKTEEVDVTVGRLVFKRDTSDKAPVDVENFWQRLKPLKGMITIVPGTDLTAPVFDEDDWVTDAWGRNLASNKEDDGAAS